MSLRARSVLLLLLLLLPARTQAQQPRSTGWAGGITPGDFLIVRIRREPEMEIGQLVPADGMIAFQRLGPIDVRGMSADSLRQQLIRLYARYLTEPESRIHLELHRKVTISGAVQKPNVYTLHPTMTLADALATAGGPLPDGRSDRVELRRDGQVLQVLLVADAASLAESPIRSGDQLYVPQRSFVGRNMDVIIPAITSVLALTIALLVR